MVSPDPVSLSWLRILIAFVTVSGLLGLLGYGLKYLNQRGFQLPGMAHGGKRRRLHLVETLPLDARRRLAIIRCDADEYLLLLGTERDIVVQAKLSPPPPPLPVSEL